MIQNLWDAAKAVLRRKFIPIQSYLRKKQKSQINNLKQLEKEEEQQQQQNPKVGRRKEIIEIREKINKIETQKTTKRSVKLKAGSLKR